MYIAWYPGLCASSCVLGVAWRRAEGSGGQGLPGGWQAASDPGGDREGGSCVPHRRSHGPAQDPDTPQHRVHRYFSSFHARHQEKLFPVCTCQRQAQCWESDLHREGRRGQCLLATPGACSSWALTCCLTDSLSQPWERGTQVQLSLLVNGEH